MNDCTKIAELIYRRFRNKKGFILEDTKDLDLILMELKKVISKTKLRLKYKFHNSNELIEQINLKGGKKLDLTLMPNRYDDTEFILWLVVVIENITDKIIIKPKRKKPKSIKPEGKDNGEAIQAYLNSQEFNK